ncbi:hypothetical protein GCM10023192_15960 [Amycolatopsis samaneae]
MVRRQAGELDDRLAAARHTSRSPDGLITAVVTGQGTLIDLSIADRALEGPHVQTVGIRIVQAVTAARDAARAEALPQLNALFGKQPPPPVDGPAAGRPTAHHHDSVPSPGQQSPRGTRASVSADDEESFEELDFLSLDEPDERGGHW